MGIRLKLKLNHIIILSLVWAFAFGFLIRSSAFAALPSHAPKARHVLFLAPHPDDEVLYSGLLMQAVQSGATVTIIYLSDGESTKGMAKSYLKEILKDQSIPKDSQEQIRLYEIIRRMEALNGLKSIKAYLNAEIETKFLGLQNISHTFIGENPTSNIQDVISSEIIKHGARSTVVYMPHPRDTNPGHQATTKLLVRALKNLSEKERSRVSVYGYLVHYGSYAGELGVRPTNTDIASSQLDFAYDREALEQLNLSSEQSVVKLDALLAHRTQVSRDDVMKSGSPLTTGYLAGFVTLPEVVERFSSDPALIPKPKPNLYKRGTEMLYRYVKPRFGGYRQDQVDDAVKELKTAAERVLPENSRARRELSGVQIVPFFLNLRTFCERLWRGPWF